MGEARRKKMQAATEGLVEVLADSGRMIEVGFEIHAKYYLSETASPEHREACRECFMMGAHHVFSTVMTMLDDSTQEATDVDMRRMTLAYEEMENFIRHFKKRHNVGDEIYPQDSPSSPQ